MLRYTALCLGLCGSLALLGCAEPSSDTPTHTPQAEIPMSELPTTDEGWKNTLSPEQFRVLRQCGTERPFTGKYWNHHADGMYRCAGCGADLFRSDTKYDSGSGWPSFYQEVEPGAVLRKPDNSHGMLRVEIVCARCGGHLGHVFDDGPAPTGERHCVNSASLSFAPAEPKK